MKSYLYLIQNGDLYYIGSDTNFEKAQELLKPGTVTAYLMTNEAATMCKKLKLRYAESRLPESSYFRLSKSELLECKLMMKDKGGSDYFQPIFKGKIIIITFIFSWIFLSFLIIKIGLEPLLNKIT